MAQIARTRVQIDYAGGGPGVTTCYWSKGLSASAYDADLAGAFADDLETTLLAMQAAFPNWLTFTVLAQVDVLEASTGEIQDQLVATDGTRIVPGTNTNLDASRATQVCVNLLTSDFVNGRRLRGRHFWGPLAPNLIISDGSVFAAFREDIPDDYSGMISGLGPRLAVWHRPTGPTASDGTYGDVTSVVAKRLPGILRSRRD